MADLPSTLVTLRANYTAAQTDAVVVAGVTGRKINVSNAQALCDNANSVDVAARLGFGTTTTPTTTGVVLTHPGIAAGSGVNRGRGGTDAIGVGAVGESLLVTSEVPTGGSLDIIVTYFMSD